MNNSHTTNTSVITTPLLPLLVVFDIECILTEWTLFPGNITLPLTKISDTEIRDKKGEFIKYFPDVPAIFEKLQKLGIKIAIFSDTDLYYESAPQIIKLFGWDKYISFQEIHPDYLKKDVQILKNIEEKSMIPCDKMIYFTYWYLIIKALEEELDVLSIRVDPDIDGMTMKLLDDALKQYEQRVLHPKSTTKKYEWR